MQLAAINAKNVTESALIEIFEEIFSIIAVSPVKTASRSKKVPRSQSTALSTGVRFGFRAFGPGERMFVAFALALHKAGVVFL